MSQTYQTKRPGDILRLAEPLPYYEPPIEAGGYVLLSVGDLCCVAVLVENAEGKLVGSNRLRDVDLADLCLFLGTGMRVDPVG